MSRFMQTVKGYELRDCIDAGKVDAVYHAYQRLIGRDVAIKVFNPEYADHPQFVRQFEVIAQRLARLEHPHMVPLYDYWREPGSAYLVMRWLPSSFARSLSHIHWSIGSTVHLLEQISAALCLAHRRNIIHANIKPSTILLDEDNNAYLAGFGVAQIFNGFQIFDEEDLTINTLIYAAPEQILEQPVTPRTDIYHIGLVLYEALIGEKPFADAPTVERLKRMHLHEPLPALTSRRPDVPPALEAVLQTATAKDPTRRYPDVLRLIAAIRAAIPSAPEVSDQPLPDPLTERELEILRLMSEGLTNTDIAQKLFLSVTTVKWYVRQIYLKLAVHSRSQAIDRGRQLHLVGERIGDFRPIREHEQIDKPFEDRRFRELRNPYKGLRAFEESDATDFFGRATLIDRLLQRLQEPAVESRFLALVGASGSGKSSAVKAGLIPALRNGKLRGSERWFIAEMSPGTHPFEELDAALRRVAVNPPPDLLSLLCKDSRGLVRAVKQILPDSDAELVLVVDQFEEAFTLIGDEASRQRFFESLVAAALDPRSQLHVIVTLRADFFDRPLLYPRLADLIQTRTEVVLPLNYSELTQAILGPADGVGVTVDPALVDVIARDVHEQPGALPLVEYALTELFERRDGQAMTVDAYCASGGVQGALMQRADKLYIALDDNAQDVARQLFLRLVLLGDGTEDTRRRVPISELTQAEARQTELDDVLELFGQYRLLTFDREAKTHSPTVEVAHEALIRNWSRLRQWLDESREDLFVRSRLSSAASEWSRAGNESSFLASGGHLAQFEALAAKATLALNAGERRYIEASIAERERQEATQREQYSQKLVLQRRATNRLHYLAAVLALSLAIVLALLMLANDSRDQALHSAREADAARATAIYERTISLARQLVAQALYHQAREPDLSLLLNVEANRLVSTLPPRMTFEIRDSLLNVLQYQGHLLATLRGHTDGVNSVAFSPDGKLLASASTDGTVRLWAIATGQPVMRPLTGHTGSVNSVAFSPDGKVLASGGEDYSIRLWDVADGHPIGAPLAGHFASVNSLAFSPSGKLLASGSAGRTIRLWDPMSGKPVGQPLIGHTDGITSVNFSPDGKQLVSASIDYTVRLWDIAHPGSAVAQIDQHGSVNTAVFSPNGKLLATGDHDGTIHFWNTDNGTGVEPSFNGHSGAITSIAFSPDGAILVSGGVDKTVRLWALPPGQPFAQLFTSSPEDIWDIAFNPNGQTLASASFSHAVQFWDARSGQALGLTLVGYADAVLSVAYSPDGKILATGGADKTVRLWNAANGQSLGPPLAGHTRHITRVRFSPNGKILASASFDHTIQLWDVVTHMSLGPPLIGHNGAVSGIAFSPDGALLASAGWDGTVRLWDVNSGNSFSLVMAVDPNPYVFDVTFSPDGKLLAAVCGNGSVRLWDLATKQLFTSIHHTGIVYAAAFSPDGLLLAYAGEGPSIQLWDIATRQLTGLPLEGSPEAVHALAFSPDSKWLVTGGKRDTIRLWSSTVEGWISRACRVANRNLTIDEWRTYMGNEPYQKTCPDLPIAD